jgi:hypothetical protein
MENLFQSEIKRDEVSGSDTFMILEEESKKLDIQIKGRSTE